MKTMAKTEFNRKEIVQKPSFIKTWINDENARKYDGFHSATT
jgi:hypothetical protein